MKNASSTLKGGSQAADIRVEGVNLSYGTTCVLRDVNLHINSGEFFAFLGPSGCGKTTLLRLIAGFNAAQSGRVLIGNVDVSTLPPWKRSVGMVFQSYALWPHMSVRRNVAFGLEERKVPKDEIESRVDAALELVGLKHLGDRKPSQLSGGQQQRVALARTVVIRPRVLLLDEPLSNLDAKLRTTMRRELLQLQRELGLTTIFVTHDQEEANTMCDRIAVMNNGIIQQVGHPVEVYDRPANLFVANFLGTVNVLDGEMLRSGTDQIFRIADSTSEVPVRGEIPTDAKLVFRPQNAAFAEEGKALESGKTRLNGKILFREFLGSTVRYGVGIGATEITVDTAHQAGDPVKDAGCRVAVDLNADKAIYIAD